ncbi:MAG: transcriptional repressor LexA [Bdellovibrionota bacterium]
MTGPMLTPKQKEVLDFITAFRSEWGYAPSQQEIAKHFGFKSLGTVQNYLVRLERQGVLQKTWNARRGMQVLSSSQPQPQTFSETVPLPLLGRVAAGYPIEAIAQQEILEVPSSMLKGGNNFALKVNGNSMIEEGILDGDYVIIKKQSVARNGQTVVALLRNEVTIKKYYLHGSKIELHPANPEYKPLVIESASELEDFRIEGVLVGVIRYVKT